MKLFCILESLFPVEAVELDSDGDLPRKAVKNLTREIEIALKKVTINAETLAEIEVADEAANLFLSVSETFDLEESLSARSEFIRNYLSEDEENEGFEIGEITGRISNYKKKLREIGLEPENLSLSSQPFWYVVSAFFSASLVNTTFLACCDSGIHFAFSCLSTHQFSWQTIYETRR